MKVTLIVEDDGSRNAKTFMKCSPNAKKLSAALVMGALKQIHDELESDILDIMESRYSTKVNWNEESTAVELEDINDEQADLVLEQLMQIKLSDIDALSRQRAIPNNSLYPFGEEEDEFDE